MKLNLREGLNDTGRDHELVDICNSWVSVLEFLTATGHPGKPHCAATRIVKQNGKAIMMFRKHRFLLSMWYMTLQEIKMKICISSMNNEKSNSQDITRNPQSKTKTNWKPAELKPVMSQQTKRKSKNLLCL